ncbi:MAG: tRNA (adenosine(37)-N6)-dimethylallyltransferase MiaA, partial [Acetobacteraceae bacterium]
TGLAEWQATTREPTLSGDSFVAILLDPPRPDLRAAIASRFRQMLDNGAVEEVRSLLALSLDPALPAMRAHGVPELAAFLRGDIDLDEAALRAISATGRYTKRQATWFRHHPVAIPTRTHTICARIAGNEQFSQRISPGIIDFIHRVG